jgi:phosphoribosylpyrophosphate synthetase
MRNLPLLLFPTNSGRGVTERLFRDYPDFYQYGQLKLERFENGDPKFYFETDADGTYRTEPNNRDCVVLSSLRNADDLEELQSTLMQLSQRARSLTVVILKFGGDTMDRVAEGHRGKYVTAKIRAGLISRSMVACPYTNLFVLAPHQEGIPYYFDDHVKSSGIPSSEYYRRVAKELKVDALAALDVGAGKLMRRVIEGMSGVRPLIVYSIRESKGNTKVPAGILGNANDVSVLGVDDLTRTLGSIVEGGRSLLAEGATQFHAAVTHMEASVETVERQLAQVNRTGKPIITTLHMLDTTADADRIAQAVIDGRLPQDRVFVHHLAHRLIHPQLERIFRSFSYTSNGAPPAAMA